MKNQCAKTGISTPYPQIGIIMLDTRFPRIKGDVGNRETFAFQVTYNVVKGASPERIVIQKDKSLIRPFIEAGHSLIRNGAKIISTSCGFLALFHKELVEALDVPVFSSSLLQVFMATSILKKNQKVGIITARKQSLTRDHLAAIGIENHNLAIVGMEDAEEFSSVFIGGKATLNVNKCRMEMRDATTRLLESHPDVGAIVLECTNMPPYYRDVYETSGKLPVFDVVTMINYAHSTISH